LRIRILAAFVVDVEQVDHELVMRAIGQAFERVFECGDRVDVDLTGHIHDVRVAFGLAGQDADLHCGSYRAPWPRWRTGDNTLSTGTYLAGVPSTSRLTAKWVIVSLTGVVSLLNGNGLPVRERTHGPRRLYERPIRGSKAFEKALQRRPSMAQESSA
jgi:hypothetical protein